MCAVHINRREFRTYCVGRVRCCLRARPFLGTILGTNLSRDMLGTTLSACLRLACGLHARVIPSQL